MIMEFKPSEVAAILKQHLVEKMGVPEEAVGDAHFMIVAQGFSTARVEIKTDKGVPAGAYRAPGTRT